MNEVDFEILFIEDREDLGRDQLDYIHYSLDWFIKYADEAKRDNKEFFSVISSISNLDKQADHFEFEMESIKGSLIKIGVRNLVHSIINDNDKAELLKKLENIHCKKPRRTLFVVDLALNPNDNTQFRGLEIAETLKCWNESFLKMTGVFTFDSVGEDYDFVNRASSQNRMQDDYPASMPSPYLEYLNTNYPPQKDNCYYFLSYLLKSGYFNRQYVGAILTKLVISNVLSEHS